MDVRKFLLVCFMVSLPVIASGCTTAKEEKATEAAGKKAAVNSAKAMRHDILKDSGTKALTMDQIGNLDSRILELARNEIYARHGYVFKRKDLRDYFEAKPWYHENPVYKDQLSLVEKQNVSLLRSYEAKYAAYKLVPTHSDDDHLRDYKGDASFKRQQMKVDLNGDGRNDQVQLISPASELEAFKLKVNDVTIDMDSELLPYFDIVDLDIDDPYFEIAVQMDLQMDFLRETSFYYYDGQTIKLTGQLPGFSAHSSMFDGHGRVVSAQQARYFQTWYREAVFRLDADHELHEQQQDFYSMTPPTPLTVKKVLTVQKSKDGKKEAYSLKPGDKVKFLGDDERGYAKLETFTGEDVWYYMGDEYVDLTDYFDGLILYD